MYTLRPVRYSLIGNTLLGLSVKSSLRLLGCREGEGEGEGEVLWPAIKLT